MEDSATKGDLTHAVELIRKDMEVMRKDIIITLGSIVAVVGGVILAYLELRGD